MATLDQPSTQARWRVRYYRDGKGVWTKTFFDRVAAEQFAEWKRLYAKPARVEPINPKDVLR